MPYLAWRSFSSSTETPTAAARALIHSSSPSGPRPADVPAASLPSGGYVEEVLATFAAWCWVQRSAARLALLGSDASHLVKAEGGRGGDMSPSPTRRERSRTCNHENYTVQTTTDKDRIASSPEIQHDLRGWGGRGADSNGIGRASST